MSDKEIADEVRSRVSGLNEAIGRAVDLGLDVRVAVREVTRSTGQTWGFVSVQIFKIV